MHEKGVWKEPEEGFFGSGNEKSKEEGKTRSAPVVDTGAVIMKKFMCSELTLRVIGRSFELRDKIAFKCEQSVNKSLSLMSFAQKIPNITQKFF